MRHHDLQGTFSAGNVSGKQFLPGIRHGCQKLVFIPADQLEHFLVFFSGRSIIICRFDISSFVMDGIIVAEESVSVECAVKCKNPRLFQAGDKLFHRFFGWCSSIGSHMGKKTNPTRCLFHLFGHTGCPLSWIISFWIISLTQQGIVQMSCLPRMGGCHRLLSRSG